MLQSVDIIPHQLIIDYVKKNTNNRNRNRDNKTGTTKKSNDDTTIIISSNIIQFVVLFFNGFDRYTRLRRPISTF